MLLHHRITFGVARIQKNSIRFVSLDAFTEKKRVSPKTDAMAAESFLNRWKLICEPSKMIYRDQLFKLRSEYDAIDENIKGPLVYRAYLTCHANQGNYKTCWSIINELRSKNLPVGKNEVTRLLFSTVNGCNINGDRGFLDARAEASRIGMTLDESFYSHALSLYSKRHRLLIKHGMHTKTNVDTAFSLFKIMVEDGIRPNVKMWGILLSTRSNYESALKVFDKMVQSGTTPNLIAYNMILRVCANSRNVKGAEKTVKIMNQSNVTMDHRAYCTLMTVYKNEGSQESLRKLLLLWEKFKKEGMADEVVISILIGACMIDGSPRNYKIAMDAFKVAQKAKKVDTSLLHAATAFAKKMNDLQQLKTIHQYCEEQGFRSTVTQLLKEKSEGWKYWKGHEPYGKIKQKEVRIRNDNLSLSVDLMTPNNGPEKSLADRRRGSSANNTVKPLVKPVSTPRSGVSPQPLATPPSRKPSSSSDRPPVPSWL
eukprot:TRINITY_DN34425_c0_g1_i1.p1 TRINITY_DN34425_c0_g1~~TRINITY_DN34425_c0_g1_i1.p1  ORF type:complete len:518 (+),score=63.84 TRINITY_DN34425_c0_g1_i1:107-1555(+)